MCWTKKESIQFLFGLGTCIRPTTFFVGSNMKETKLIFDGIEKILATFVAS